jgi:hypothetical protein
MLPYPPRDSVDSQLLKELVGSGQTEEDARAVAMVRPTCVLLLWCAAVRCGRCWLLQGASVQ